MTLSVTIPTHNRLELWRSGWLLLGLRAQADPDFEAVIVDDHSSDGTLNWLTQHFTAQPPPFSVALCRVLADVPGPRPASCIPDNIAVHAAHGDAVLHLDDDLAVDPGLVTYVKTLPLDAPAVVWARLAFCADDGQPMAGPAGEDSRTRYATTRGRKPDTRGLVLLYRGRPYHWGGGYAVTRDALLRIGGGDLNFAGYRNTDTQLGTRLVRSGCRSYFSLDPRMRVRHLGPTWFRLNRDNYPLIKATRHPVAGDPLIANGGRAFWTSAWFDTAYEVAARFPAA